MSRQIGAFAVLFFVACVVLIPSVQLFGQAINGTLLRIVIDTTRASIPNAKITIQETTTGISRDTVTNESGNCTFLDLKPGHQAATVESNGSKKVTRLADVIIDSATRGDVQLQAGSATEVVTVTDVPPLLQTGRADISTKLETQQVVDMPFGVNRNFQSLLNLVPAQSQPRFNTRDHFFKFS